MPDTMQRFIFDNTDVRGELVQLQRSFQETLDKHNYTAPVTRLLGDFLSAAALLSATLKFDGTLTLQARSDGQVPLIMAEATSTGKLRGIARGAENANSEDFQQLLSNGQLAITITPHQGQRYQGVVPLDGTSLAECLEHYFQQSEQLATRLWFASNQQYCTGMLLQELPASAAIDADTRREQWLHLTHLAQTISEQELLSLDAETLLHRLYHQEQVRLFEPSQFEFQCSCSELRTANAIKAIGQQEAQAIIEEQGTISIHCEFCHHHYNFDLTAINTIFSPPVH